VRVFSCFAQEGVMSIVSIERKTVSLPKTVKTVENGCWRTVTGQKSTGHLFGWT
jgi:hypothetical protein